MPLVERLWLSMRKRERPESSFRIRSLDSDASSEPFGLNRDRAACEVDDSRKRFAGAALVRRFALIRTAAFADRGCARLAAEILRD